MPVNKSALHINSPEKFSYTRGELEMIQKLLNFAKCFLNNSSHGYRFCTELN